jgi:hypothetical protein
MIHPEYLETVFLAETQPLGWPERFHIITAFNPGVVVSNQVNSIADVQLRKELNNTGSRCFRVIGCSPDLKHQEQGWGVSGLSQEKAVELGSRYGQNAIFEVSDGFLSVIGCQSGNKIPVDEWQKRILADSSS